MEENKQIDFKLFFNNYIQYIGGDKSVIFKLPEGAYNGKLMPLISLTAKQFHIYLRTEMISSWYFG